MTPTDQEIEAVKSALGDTKDRFGGRLRVALETLDTLAGPAPLSVEDILDHLARAAIAALDQVRGA